MAIPTRRLGRTGHDSSIAILGAACFAEADEASTERAFRAAVDAGVNHLDIAPRYGSAERLVGPLLPAVRDRMFVGCKTTRANADGARAQMEQSLDLLRTDHFDLYQMHGVTDLDDLDRRAPAAGAIVRARDEGLCTWIGVTGHGMGAPRAHAEAVRRYDLDTVMFPVNARLWADVEYRRDAEALLALCAERNVGVMAIKACAARPWSSGHMRDPANWATTWYEPYTSVDDIERSIRFTLSVPGVVGFCTPGDLAVLDRALEAASRFEPMDDRERAVLSGARAGEALIFPMPTA